MKVRLIHESRFARVSLYRIDRDSEELYDRAEEYADRKQELVALWEQYARENGVVVAKPEPAPEGGADEAAQKSSPSDR